MKKHISLALASIFALFAVSSCDIADLEELFDEPVEEFNLVTDEPDIRLQIVEVESNSIKVKADVRSLGYLADRENIDYGFVYFLTPSDDNESQAAPEQEKMKIGTMRRADQFTYETTIERLEAGTSYNVCTYMEAGQEMMFGDEQLVETDL